MLYEVITARRQSGGGVPALGAHGRAPRYRPAGLARALASRLSPLGGTAGVPKPTRPARARTTRGPARTKGLRKRALA